MFSIISKNSAKFSEKLLTEILDGKRTFVEILTDCLKKINREKDWFDHMGFVSACAALLNGLGMHFGEYKYFDKVERSLADLMKMVVFCRPDNPLAMVELSEFFRRSIGVDFKFRFLKYACVRSKLESFVIDLESGLVGFTGGKLEKYTKQN